MRLSRLYSNRPGLFKTIEFNRGLNVVLGEIRLPENKERSTHNLGKTTLAKLIDFSLLLRRHKDFFLFKHARFRDFVFYVEIETLSGDYVTVRRSVENASKIDIAVHSDANRDFTSSSDFDWKHRDLAFDRGRLVLDAILALSAVKPWSFRQPVSYSLRTQNDFRNVFQLGKFKSKHKDWKPYVAHILGFNSKLVKDSFDGAQEIESTAAEISTLNLELGAAKKDLDELRGLIKIKQSEAIELERAISDFNFELQDAQVNQELVEQIDQRLAQLNGRRYALTRAQKRITDSLNANRIGFRTEVAKKLYKEAGKVFPNQLEKQFDDLIRFNQEISVERIDYLKQELSKTNTELTSVMNRISDLNDRRQTQLQFLGDTDAISKFRKMNAQLVEICATLESLRRQSEALARIREKEKILRKLKRDREDLIEAIEADIDAKSKQEDSRYSQIRANLNSLTERFLKHKSLIVTKMNQQGNIEFEAEYLNADDRPTSEDEGKSFKQLLCAAYDLAVTSELLNDEFIRFIYHDGLLEGLDARVKIKVLEVLREYSARGVQQILTVLDSDLPILPDGNKFSFNDEEVILRLNDEGSHGRLFHFDTW